MTISQTTRPFTKDLQLVVKRLFKRAADDTGVSLASIAHGAEKCAGLVERWADDRAERHLPVWALASATAIPEKLYARLIHDIDGLRHAQDHGVVPKPMGACTALLGRLGAGVENIASALADGKVTSAERAPLLRKLAEIEASIASVRRAFDYENARAS